jgi:hypothetical protein
MVDIKREYATSTAITIALENLASSLDAGRECTAIDNGTNKYIDALVQLRFKLLAGTPAADRAVYVYAYGSEDGTNYTDNATGADANITLRNPPICPLIGVINCPDAGGLTYKSNPMSIAKAFDWILPRKWGVIIRNNTNIAFSATGGDHVLTYSGEYFNAA